MIYCTYLHISKNETNSFIEIKKIIFTFVMKYVIYFILDDVLSMHHQLIEDNISTCLTIFATNSDSAKRYANSLMLIYNHIDLINLIN